VLNVAPPIEELRFFSNPLVVKTSSMQSLKAFQQIWHPAFGALKWTFNYSNSWTEIGTLAIFKPILN